ncbi:MAG: MFS transporter [Rhodobacteraceae bacterium]|nr:MFS transporter [Paracoccaceae bacterium]
MSNAEPTEPIEQLGGRRAWAIWSLAALAFGYAFFHRVTPSVMVSDLMSEFAISGAMLGTLSALYFYPYVVLQIPLGAILDVVGTRIILTAALSIAALGSLLFGSATSIEVAYIGRVLIGIGSSVGFLGALTLAGKWFPIRKFALLSGLTMFVAMMSGMMAQGPLAIFVSQFGWRSSMWGLAIFGGSLALLVYVFVRNEPENRNIEKKHKDTWKNMWSGLARAARTREVWKIALVAATMSAPMLTVGGLWGTPYLMSAYELERPEAAFYMSLMLFGWAFGAPFTGWLSDYIGHRKALLVFGSGILSVTLGIIVFVPNVPLWLTVGLFVLAGASGSAMATTFALVREVSPTDISGSVVGIVNSMTVASGAILQPLVGVFLDARWDGTLIEGARIYSESDYRWSFAIVFASAVVGFITCLNLNGGTK